MRCKSVSAGLHLLGGTAAAVSMSQEQMTPPRTLKPTALLVCRNGGHATTAKMISSVTGFSVSICGCHPAPTRYDLTYRPQPLGRPRTGGSSRELTV